MAHALREIIANALDEHVTAGVKEQVSILFEEPRVVRIADFGRGIKQKHFMLNESKEKERTKSQGGSIIGLFGFGLKDAMVCHSFLITQEGSSS